MPFGPLILLAALATAPAQDPDPAALVAKLASGEPAVRDAAAGELEGLGRRGLPALEQAIKAGEPALRGRATALWEAIGRDWMARPSPVRLDGRDRSVAGVLEDLSSQTGLTLAGQGLRERRSALFEPTPVPFWSAIERLGVGSIYYRNPGHGKFPDLDLHDNPGALNSAAGPPRAFTSVSGPFRVSLTGLHLHRDRQLIRGPWVRIDGFGQRINVPGGTIQGDSPTFFGDLELMVEPRMWFTQEGPARLIEAVDDLGQSLLPEASAPGGRREGAMHFATESASGVTQSRAEFGLRIADRPGRAARVRGVVPVMLHLRYPEPALDLPLAGAAGRTFRGDDVEFTFQSVDDSPTATLVSLIARLDVGRADLPDQPDGALVTSRLQVMGNHQLQLTDAGGAVRADSISSGGGGGSTPAVYRWTISTFSAGRATHFRYYRMLRVRSEASFDFRDVPLP